MSMAFEMNKTFQQEKNIKKGIKFFLSDAFLAIGLLFSIPFYAFAWKFMVTEDPNTIPLNINMIIACFALTMVCWGIYLYLEIKAKRMPPKIVTWLFVALLTFFILSVMVQPTVQIIPTEVRIINSYNTSIYPGIEIGSIIDVVTNLSVTHRVFFVTATIIISTIFFIILFVFPKRLNNINFLIPISVIVFVFLFFVVGYSYVVEHNEYIEFIKAALKPDGIMMGEHAVASFLTSKVPYGACLMMGVMFALVVGAVTHRWYWNLFGAFFYINMLFTFCRTSILITTGMIALYVIYELIRTFRKHIVRNIIFVLLILFTGFIFVVLFLISVISQGRVLGYIFSLFKIFFHLQTMYTRTLIWRNIFQLLGDGWIVLGRGFGTFNYFLYPMNVVNGDYVCPAHSTYLAVLGSGGIFALIAFLSLYLYYGYIFIRSMKYDPIRTLQLSLPVLAFFLYSFTEGVIYLIVVFMCPLIYFYYSKKKEMAK